MEQSISSLTFKGSISEAIVEAKRQKKLFVVYISGEDAESIRLEKSTWMDLNVAESLSKYCILLHITEGSTDAAHFSAIYPQKSIPCITAIGHNGVQLWQNEGFVNAEILASSLEKAWLSLHIQETTATVLTAALASKKSEPSTSGVSNTPSFEEGSSSSMDVPSPSTDNHGPSSEARPLVTSEIVEDFKGCERTFEEINSKLGDEVSSKSIYANELVNGEDEQSASSSETDKELLSPVMVDLDNSGVCCRPSVEGGCPPPEENINVNDQHSGLSQLIANKVMEAVQDEKDESVEDKNAEAVEDKKADALDICTSVNDSNDVHLNIRFPDGASLQEKFSVTSTLRIVKDYVDKNQASSIGSYDLAIPYPRKVFSDQDLSKSLSDLGLFNRQALIVVPHQRATGYDKGESSSRDSNSTTNVDSSKESNGGYFAYVKRILSYMNPFSYLAGNASSSSSGQESQDGMWQYRPNPTIQNNHMETERPYTRYSPNQNTPATGRNNDKSKQPTTSRFGSNIHTLKRDKDDGRFSDKNAFWNGNSTQYGGDNDGK